MWRSSGNRLLKLDELKNCEVSKLQAVFRDFSRSEIYDYEEHAALAGEFEDADKLPASFSVAANGSWSPWVWDDINRMYTLNSRQSQKEQQMHVCPLQIDTVTRIINRYSNPGELVLDPFGGLMTVPYIAIKMRRRGYGIELNPDYFQDGVKYLQAIEREREAPVLFDMEEVI
jgi:DNA modification methylase